MAKDNSKTEDKDIIGLIKPQTLETEMQDSYLEYAMSVIVSRALPDVRDGMKPVHRRILYSMHDQGLRHNAKFRKSAAVVGDVIAKYHPHGDTAIYDSMVHMAQDFAMRYQLVDGQGNFGSMDGDKAAAYRYTEARMQSIAEELLVDIDKDTVDFRDNFDASRQEPSVLPGKLPNLLLNGTLGIAVGMATDIPPHNLTEVSNAIIAMIENPNTTIDELCDIVTGPDYPTGGMIYDKQAIKNAYATGKGSIVVRGRAEIEEMSNGNYRIIVNEIPYRVNKATLLEKIADLVRDKKLEGIKDVRDESDKDGVRIVVELKKDALANKILNQLFSYTQLQNSHHMNILALEGGIQPRVMNLKTVLEHYLEHRQVVVRRRTEYELRKAKERAHILEGLKIALDNIDEVIKVIKKSPSKEEAGQNLIKKFKLSEIQTQAILEMRLQTLAGLERKKIEDELKEKLDLIKKLEGILGSKKKIFTIIKEEVIDLRDRFGDERKTLVVPNALGDFSVEDLIPESNVIISITESGYIKRQAPDTYRKQARGGKGVIGQSLKEEDVVNQLITANTHDDILFFTNKGRVLVTKAYELPESSRVSKGQALVNFLQLSPDEHTTAVLPIHKDGTDKFFVMATKKGVVKRVKLSDFARIRRNGIIAITIKDGDELKWVKSSSGNDEIMFTSENGQAVRFKEKDVRVMGRTAAGVAGMRLKKGDSVISMDVIHENDDNKDLEVLIVTEKGLGKKTKLADYKTQKRGGSGVKTVKITPKTGKIICMMILDKTADQDLVMMSKHGQMVRTAVSSISTLSRATQGVKLMGLSGDDTVATATVV